METKIAPSPARYDFCFLTVLQVLFSLLLFAGPALAAPGDLDFSFGVEGKVTTDLGSSSEDHAMAVAVQPDGKIVVAGERVDSYTSGGIVVARYLSDGKPDPAFGAAGRVITRTGGSQEGGRALVIQPDGKIVVAGTTYREGSQYDFVLIRYQADGTLDPAFGAGGIATTNITRDDQAGSILLQADGKIVVAGFTDLYRDYNMVFALVRYSADGEIDSGFGQDGKVITDIGAGPEGVSSVLIQEDQKIVAVGTRDGRHFALARYGSDGALDPSFGTGGIVSIPISPDGSSGEARSAALQPDGKIVVAGNGVAESALYGKNRNVLIARFKPDGTLDGDFGMGGRVLTDLEGGRDEVATQVMIDRGRIIVGGNLLRSNTSARGMQFDFLLIRYLADGRLDSAFGAEGHTVVDFGQEKDDLTFALSLQADGKIVLAGEAVQAAGGRDFALARFLNEPIDTDPPATETVLLPAPNPAGWNHTDVRLTLSAADPGVGVKEIRYAIGQGPEVTVAGATAVLELTSEGIFRVRYRAVDFADNAEEARLIHVRIDKTGPAVLSSQSPLPNPTGWNKVRVTVDFSGEDALSGGGLCNPATVSVAAEGAHQSIQTTCTDASGNQTVSSREVNLDATPPVLTLPPLASTYPLNSTIFLPYGADDPLSGVASVAATLDGEAVSNGAAVTLSRAGVHTFSLTASDRAGNSATRNLTFTVGCAGPVLPPLRTYDAKAVKIGNMMLVDFWVVEADGSLRTGLAGRLLLWPNALDGQMSGSIDPSKRVDPASLFRFPGDPHASGVWLQKVMNQWTLPCN